MTTPSPRGRVRTGTLLGAAAAFVISALVVTLAVMWPGFDARQTPVDDGTVWAVQTGAGDAYARVNLELGELDTVKTAENASSIAQTADRLFVFAERDTQFADVSMAAPSDLTATTTDAFTRAPAGTVQTSSSGDFLTFRTDAGGVYAATLSGGGRVTTIDPYADVAVDEGQERPRFIATATAVDADGTVYAYSSAESRVIRADARTGRILGEDAVAGAPEDVQLSAVAGRWVLLDESDGSLRVRGREAAVPTGTTAGARLERTATATAATAREVYIADTDGLVRVSLEEGTAERVVADTLGTPAAPLTQNGVTSAAWLRDGDGGGTLWTTADPTLNPLDYGAGTLGDQIDPEFVTNGVRLALNERSSGWVWTVPEGGLIPSSQQWSLEENTDASPDDDTVAERVIDPKPPVAVDDEFGVRAGSVAALPVLLNDHDPNEDVLSVDVASISGLDPAFGTVSVSGAEQSLVVDVAPDASGTATFRYRVTDGTSEDGLYSNEATVTLTVVDPDTNRPPAPCDPGDCLAERPRPNVAPGGTVTFDALYGWIDPDGDPIYLAGVENETGLGSAAGQPTGALTYQHPDAQASEAVDVTLALTVADSRGATARRNVTVAVTPAPQLRAESFAVVGVAGRPLSIDVASRVSGTTGTPVLSSAVVLDETAATVTPNAAGLSLEFRSDVAGSYPVQYTVRDDRGEQTASVRVTLRDPDETAISTPPLTAFVRPGEDTTVDVFPPVANPAGLVLLLSDLRPESAALASMSVDLVGQSLIRVSGTTDDGAPGVLGVVRYTVSDGSGAGSARAEGELTVILLDSPSSDPPIAVDDAVTVRAGAQIDIPVLSNDSAPSGALFSIDPSTIVNESGGGLAFATSSLVRYLAPDEPGTYGIGYTISRLGFPDATDSARVVVTVVGDEANRAPLPRVLEGRVLSGETVRIPFDRFGVDPDGDAVTLDRIVDQPAQGGTATISPEGDAILYSSPDGFSGQDSFTYQVRDTEGAVGQAQARVGVLAAASDPSPVTFSDYLQIQVGEDSEAIVRPTDNDIDPGGGELTLESVVPNAPAGSEEYDTLAALLGEIVDGQVTLRGGLTPGTSSYIYTVRNSSGDTAQGLIVVKAVPMPVPDYPVVTDTSLTLETRETFPQGVDVLTGKVAWATGDAAGLRMKLWGTHPGIRVEGARIFGEVPAESLLIPFEVSGTAFDGTEVTSYGFLRVPGDQDIRLALRADAARIEVRENESRDLDLATAIAIPPGRTLQVDGDGVRSGGARPAATCALVSGTTIRYTAGADAPWTDTCIVPVKLDVQDAYTFLTVRVAVEAEDPEPILRSASLSVSPGQSQEYDLTSMVRWAGREDWDSLRFADAYRGDQFTVVRSGSTLTVTAADAARPGREESVAISLSSHPDAVAAALIMTVGPAPSQLPKGGTASERCSQAGGTTSCTITVIGVSGEINPLPGTPLALVSVRSPANCPGVTFAKASATSVRASWSSDTPGAADCAGSFVVADAQGRQSAGERNGTVLLDLQGLPAAPTRLEWIGFDADSVTLRVIADSRSYPSVEGFRITAGGDVVATCDASGACPPIDAEVGVPRTYQARAFSSVGESRSAVQTSAWAYAAPAAPTGAQVDPVPNGTSGGVATIVVRGIDATTGSVTLTGGAGGSVTQPVQGSTATFTAYNVGSNSPTSLTATPLTRFELPPIPGGSQSGSAFSFRANGIGAPTLAIEVTASRSSDPGTVTAVATVSPNGTGERIMVGFTDGSTTCVPDQAVAAGGGTASKTYTKELWREVTITACAVTERGGQGFGRTEKSGSATPTSGVPTPTGRATYAVAAQARQDGATFTWDRFASEPDLTTRWPFEVRYRAGDAESTRFRDVFPDFGDPGTVTAVACSRVFGCGDPVTVTADGPAYRTQVSFPTSCQSDPGGQQPTTGDVAVRGANPGDVTVTRSEATDADGTLTLTYSVRWSGRLAGLDDASFAVTCEPLTPEPEPEPEPEPDPAP
jgi:hypothetical protein